MIGRGTRLCPNLFGDGRDKEEFYIFDPLEKLWVLWGKARGDSSKRK